jgi:hypothetical protein
MMSTVPPLLAQFATPSKPRPPLPLLERDSHSGLLRRPDADRPVVDELLALKTMEGADLYLATVVTETTGERDPDSTRADSTRRSPRLWLDSTATDYKNVIPDPDVVRSAWTGEHRARLAGLVTDVRKGPVPDQPDPDFGRDELMALTVTWRTFGKEDKLDPEGGRDQSR